MKINEFLKMEYGELEKRLIDTYHKQKLSGGSFKTARVISFVTILLILLVAWEEINWFFALLWLIGLAVEGFRFFNPGSETEDTLADLKLISVLFENYKKCVNGEAEIELDEKQMSKATKQIEKCLPYLLKNSTSSKVVAFIPVLSLFQDEMHSYSHVNGASYRLLKSGYFPGFTDENVKIKVAAQ